MVNWWNRLTKGKPAFQKQASDGHLPSGGLPTQPGWALPANASETPGPPFTILSSPLAALKKAFSEDDEIQRTIDENFVVLNLVVSQKSAVTQQKLWSEPLIPELSTKVLQADLWVRPEKTESMSVLQAGLRQNSVIISLLFSSQHTVEWIWPSLPPPLSVWNHRQAPVPRWTVCSQDHFCW